MMQIGVSDGNESIGKKFLEIRLTDNENTIVRCFINKGHLKESDSTIHLLSKKMVEIKYILSQNQKES